MSDSDSFEVQKLIRLKRHERPPDGYYEDFLLEFQHRQRAEMLRRSAFSLWLERVATWFSSFGTRKWVYAGGAAYAALMISAYLRSEPEDPMQADGAAGVEMGASAAAPLPLSNPSTTAGNGVATPDQPAGLGRSGEGGNSSKAGDEGLQPVSSPAYREL